MPDSQELQLARVFTLERQIRLDANRERVFDALTRDVNSWWAYKGDARARMTLEPWPGGRFFESDGESGFLWATVVQIQRPTVLRVSEPLGSLDVPRAGAAVYRLEESGKQTVLKFSYQGLGHFDEAAILCLTSGWDELLSTHLRAWVEQGTACG